LLILSKKMKESALSYSSKRGGRGRCPALPQKWAQCKTGKKKDCTGNLWGGRCLAGRGNAGVRYAENAVNREKKRKKREEEKKKERKKGGKEG